MNNKLDCQKALGVYQLCEKGTYGCTVHAAATPGQLSRHASVSGSPVSPLGRRASDRPPPPTSNAARLGILEKEAYDGGTRLNRIDFLTFQVPNLLSAVSEIVKIERKHTEDRSRHSDLALAEYKEVLAALGCSDMMSALAKIDTLKAQAQLNSWPVSDKA